MKNNTPTLVSDSLQIFINEAPRSTTIQDLANPSALDRKTAALAYLAVLAVLDLENGIPFHVQTAKKMGASRDEIISAILVGLPAEGHDVTQVLPTAIAAYNSE